jgi:biotin operon repressor
MDPITTTEQDAQTLALLKAANRPLHAVQIADRLGLAGNRETRRRHVRAIIKTLRDNGHWIVATRDNGYALTRDADLWADYQAGREIDARRIFADTHKHKRRMLIDKSGQGHLFRG